MRYEKLYAHYFDLGIMQQTVYNTYQGIKTRDMSRILEVTDPLGSTQQVKRMAIHNDVFLLFLAPFYFIHDGPATLLVIQSVILGLGAYAVFLITQAVFNKEKYADYFAVIFAYGYLLYPPLQKANNFDFHAVTLATTFLLAMYYFWMKKKYGLSLAFAIMSILTKEQVGLTVAFFGIYAIINSYTSHTQFSFASLKKHIVQLGSVHKLSIFIKKNDLCFGLGILSIGLIWVAVSMFVIIPYFRMGDHFGTKYFSYLSNAPWKAIPVIFRYETIHYASLLLAPLGFLSLFAPFQLLIALPDAVMNILADNDNMRNIYFHYGSVITPFIFISAIYAAHSFITTKFEVLRNVVGFIVDRFELPKKSLKKFVCIINNPEKTIMYVLVGAIAVSSLYMSPLPWGHHRDMYPWHPFPAKYQDIKLWKMYLEDDMIKVSSTGHLAPHFASRRYFYNFAEGYDDASYVVIDRHDITRGFQSDLKYTEYQNILRDFRYIKMYDTNGIEVFKRLKN